MSRFVFFIALPASLIACTGGSGPDEPHGKVDDTGFSMPYCEATTTELALDEVTALGFSAQDMVALAGGSHMETMRWADGTTSALTVVATLDGGARYVDEEPVYPTGSGSTADIGVLCEDRVEVDGSLQITTADGLLDELVEVAFTSADGAEVDARADLDPDDLTGTLVFDDFHQETDYDERSMSVHATFDASGSRGEVEGQISGSGDCDPGEICTAWAGQVSIGSWGVEGE